MSAGLIDNFFASRLQLVRCSDWFAADDYKPGADAVYRWYVATLGDDGVATVWRRIDPAKLDAERDMVREHNERVAALGDASRSRRPAPPLASTTIEAGRRQAAAQRGGPSPLFNPQT